MKALTVCQPYSELIVSGEKWVENRRWPTSHRGPLAIHAGKSKEWFTCDEDEALPRGVIVGVAQLVGCVRLDDLDPLKPDHQRIILHEHSEGPWCWLLENVRRIEPIPYRGQQGLFEIPDSVLEGEFLQ